MTGYSDRINHALAFAAKHHDQLVRRGTRPPYFTQPANIAVILTRYGLDEASVTAGILLEVVEDYAREGIPSSGCSSGWATSSVLTCCPLPSWPPSDARTTTAPS